MSKVRVALTCSNGVKYLFIAISYIFYNEYIIIINISIYNINNLKYLKSDSLMQLCIQN